MPKLLFNHALVEKLLKFIYGDTTAEQAATLNIRKTVSATMTANEDLDVQEPTYKFSDGVTSNNKNLHYEQEGNGTWKQFHHPVEVQHRF
jgi:hypothetical protein